MILFLEYGHKVGSVGSKQSGPYKKQNDSQNRIFPYCCTIYCGKFYGHQETVNIKICQQMAAQYIQLMMVMTHHLFFAYCWFSSCDNFKVIAYNKVSLNFYSPSFFVYSFWTGFVSVKGMLVTKGVRHTIWDIHVHVLFYASSIVNITIFGKGRVIDKLVMCFRALWYTGQFFQVTFSSLKSYINFQAGCQ